MFQPQQMQWHFLSCLLFFVFYISSSPAYSAADRFNSSEPVYTFLGGNNNESTYAIAIDSNGNIFVTGQTNSDSFDTFGFGFSDGFSPDFIENNPTKIHFNQNCFILKISSTNASEDFFYEFAGSKRETCREIAIDSQDNIYLTGETQSNDLPVTTNTTFGGEWDAFLLKLSNNGALLYASYLGGSLTDYGHGLAVKSVDQVYITGETWSTDFPTTDNAFMADCTLYTSCKQNKITSKANAFLTHVNTSNPYIFDSQYSTYLGGNNQDKAHDLAIDTNGHLHIVGETRSADFPLVFLAEDQTQPGTNNIFRNSINGTYDGFLSIIDPEKSSSESLIMSTYIGGSSDDFVFSVATDAAGSSFITGETWSDDFPVSKNAFSNMCANGYTACNPDNKFSQHSDAFVTVISHAQSGRILYSTLLGGSNIDIGHDIYIKDTSIYIAGVTSSNDFPITDNAIKTICNKSNNCKSNSDGFILKIDLNKDNNEGLTYSSYLGGNDNDRVFSFTSTKDGQFFLTGETFSSDLLSNPTPKISLDEKIENGEAFLQEINIKNNGTWTGTQARKNKQPITNNQQRVMASNIGPFTLFLVLAFTCLVLIWRIVVPLHIPSISTRDSVSC